MFRKIFSNFLFFYSFLVVQSQSFFQEMLENVRNETAKLPNLCTQIVYSECTHHHILFKVFGIFLSKNFGKRGSPRLVATCLKNRCFLPNNRSRLIYGLGTEYTKALMVQWLERLTSTREARVLIQQWTISFCSCSSTLTVFLIFLQKF